MKRIIQLFLFTLFAFSADAQRIKLLQLERYLGDSTGSNGTFKKDGLYYRQGYVGLTDTLGDQYYRKLDSIIVRIADSLDSYLPDADTDEQYFDTFGIVDDTLVASIVRDGEPAHRIPLTGLSGDHDWYEVGTTDPPNNNSDFMYNTGKVTIGDNASYTQSLAVPLSDIRVQEIIIGYSADGESSNLRIGKNSMLNNVFGSGLDNVAIGINTLENNTTADENFALGARTLKNTTTGGYNVAIGADAMVSNVDGFTNVAIGSLAISACTLCDYNLAIGFASMFDKSEGDYNVGIGSLTLAHNDSSFNTAIGFQSMFDAPGNENVAIGWNALYGTSNTGSRNVALGFQAGRNARGPANVFLGYNAGRNTSASSFAAGNKLYIENTDSNTPLIWGDFLGDTVRINGSFQVTNRLGTATVLAGWRGNDGKAVQTGLGAGLSISSGVLNYTPLIDQFEIIDDTLYISETGDGVDPFFVDLKSYIDTATAGYDTDSQSISQFYVDMDSLIISIQRGNRKAVYLGDLISIVETDNQRFDTATLDGCTLILSIQRDSLPAYEIDLCSLLDDTDTDDQYFDSIYIVDNKLRISIHDDGVATHVLDLASYLSSYGHAGTTNYQNTLYNGANTAGAFTLSAGTGISISGGASANVLFTNTGMITWFLDGLDDAFVSTEIFTGNVASFQGAGGITAYLAADGSSTMVIDATGVDTDTDDQNLTLSTLSATQYGLNITDGTGTTFTKGPGILLTRTTNDLKIEAVDTSVTNEIPTLTHSGTGELLSTFSLGIGSINIKAGSGITAVRSGSGADGIVTISSALAAGDHDWYESGTTIPPDNIGDTMYHMGYTAIGMEHPLWILDVVSDARISGHHIGTGPTVGSNSNLRFGKDALEVNAGNHNIAIGRAALKANVSTSTNLAIGNEAMTNHTSGSGLNIAIGHSALNNSVSSYDNTAIGHTAMYGSITSSYNTALGHGALLANLRGDENTAIGDYVLLDDTNSVRNTAMGRYSMLTTRKSIGNVSVGYEAMRELKDSARFNTAIGYGAMFGSSTSTQHEYNTAIGYRAMSLVAGSSDKNIFIGYRAGETINGFRNIGIGDSVLFSTVGNNNVALGNKLTTGSVSDNVIIGYNQHMTSAGNVVLTNGAGIQGLRMLSTGLWGVNEATPTQRWHVNGNMRVTGAYYDSNNEPGTSGQVLSSTVTGTDWITSTGMASFYINGIDDSHSPTSITNGGTIAFQGTNGITAKLPVSGSGTIVIDGAGVTGTSNLSFVSSTGTVPLTSSSGTDVQFVAGSGISLSTGGGTTSLTITASEVDGSITNEGSLSLLSGPTRINSNTSGSTPITLTGSGINIIPSGSTLSFGLVAELDGFKNITGTGVVSRTGAGTYVTRSITAGTNISVTNGDGVSGAPTINMSLSNDLLAVENLATNGMVARTATNTWTTRTIQGGSGITVTNGDGVSGNPTISLSGAAGTVTSVAMSTPTGITVSGSPITTSGTFTLTLNNDLQGVENLGTLGIVVRSASNTWITRSLGAGPGINLSAADGTTANPTITAQVVDVVAGNNIIVTDAVGVHTVAQPAFTSLATGFGSGSVVFIDASSTPDTHPNYTFNSGTQTLSVSNIITNNFTAGNTNQSGTLTLGSVPTHADEAAALAAGLTTGRVYKTSAGDLRIKL